MILRKPAFVIFLFCLSQALSAQIAKGTIMAGGSLGFQFITDKENHVSDATFSLTPLIGGFVAKNFVLGVAPIAQYSESTGNITDSISTIHIHTSTLSLGLGPFARYYIKIGPKVYVFIHGSPSIMSTWNRYSSDPGNPISRTVSAYWVLGPGLSVMLSKNVAIELSLYYNGTWHRSAQFVNGNLLGNPGGSYVDNGVVFNAGFQVYFERNKKNNQTAQPH